MTTRKALAPVAPTTVEQRPLDLHALARTLVTRGATPSAYLARMSVVIANQETDAAAARVRQRLDALVRAQRGDRIGLPDIEAFPLGNEPADAELPTLVRFKGPPAPTVEEPSVTLMRELVEVARARSPWPLVAGMAVCVVLLAVVGAARHLTG